MVGLQSQPIATPITAINVETQNKKNGDRMNAKKMCDILEAKIIELQNENYADPRVHELLDLEADIVLQEYYQWQDSNNVTIE